MQKGITLTINDDGSVTINGTATGDTNTVFILSSSAYMSLDVGKNYALKGYGMNTDNNFYWQCWIKDPVGRFKDIGSGATFLYGKESEFNFAVIVESEKTVNATFWPMLNEGSTALPWEPYTGGKPSPSPEYPQEIVSTDVTAVTVTGENQSKTITIPLSEPLHGIDDVRDRIALRDSVWGIERRFGTQIFDGSSDEAWVAVQNTDGVNYRNGTSILKASTKANGKGCCSCLGQSNVVNSTQGFKIAGDASIITYSEAYNTSDVSLWTAYLAENPMTIVYELATPLWESFPAETQTALTALTTHPGTTYLTVTSTDVSVPMRLEYVQDTRKVIDSLKLDVAEQMVELQAQIDQLKVTNNLS